MRSRAALAFAGVVVCAACDRPAPDRPRASRSAQGPTPGDVPATRAEGPAPARPSVASAAAPAPEDANLDALLRSWKDAPGCIGARTDRWPAPCEEPTGCYKLELMDFALEVLDARGDGLTAEAAKAHYAAELARSSSNPLKDCFAYELGRGRPPTGRVRLALQGRGGECTEDVPVIGERSAGLKTAECLRDVIRAYALPKGRGTVALDVEIEVSGL